VGMAFPGLMAAPAEAWKRMVDTSYSNPVMDDDQLGQISRDSFDAAGLAMTGGLGAAGVGMVDNALGSAGGNLAKGAADLPMDLASRMARAREMGFDTERTLYHGTDATFDAFDLDKFGKTDWGFRGRGVYMTPDSELAGRYGENVGSYYVRGNVGSSDDSAVSALRGAAFKEASEQGKAQGLDEYALDAFRKERMNQAMRDAGYSSYFDETGQEVVVFDPRNIRSTSAAFDPAMSDSANLLAANAKTGAAVPLATNALERQPQGIRAYHGGPGSNPYFDDGRGVIEKFVPGREGAVFSTDNPVLAGDYTAARYPDRQTIYPLDVRFRNPMMVDRATDYRMQKDIFDAARSAGNDGVILQNADDSITGMPDRGPSTVFAALQPGTVYSATTGDLLYANAPTGAALPIGMEASQGDEIDIEAILAELLRGRK
jgi:hypothetical protein